MVDLICRNIVVVGLVCIATYCHAQFNVKVGYNVASPMFNEIEGLLSDYQPERGDITKEFGGINFMHGIDLGFRYSFNNTSLELGWSSVSRDKSSLAYVTSSDSFVGRAYSFGMSGVSLGVDNYFGVFGIGSMISRSNLSVKRQVASNDLSVIDESIYQLRLHLIWQIQQSDFVSLVLKPYYQFGLGEYNLAPLATDLNIIDPSSVMESPTLFGISLFFYNGRQRR